MIVVAITDLHGRTRGLEEVGSDLAAADLVLLTGDITNFGGRERAARIVDAVRAHNANLLALHGNCDRPEVAQYLVDEDISLDCRHVVREGVAFLGVGASLPCPGRTPSEITEDDFELHLSEAARGLDTDIPWVLAIHQPPRDTGADRIHSGAHVGSRSVRRFIERHQPLACFCGHIHESRGMDAISDTQIVNPGPVAGGGYARAVITDGIQGLDIRSWR